jgi:hypothetical protein
MKKTVILLLLTFSFFSLAKPKSIEAKRLVPQAKVQTGGSATTQKATDPRISTKVVFRGDRKAIIATFSNLSVAKKVDYSLTYSARGTTQGATGSIKADAQDPTTREIIFGTCSHGVCRYDSGITNARFVVTTTLTSGKKVAKTFRLKV